MGLYKNVHGRQKVKKETNDLVAIKTFLLKGMVKGRELLLDFEGKRYVEFSAFRRVTLY